MNSRMGHFKKGQVALGYHLMYPAPGILEAVYHEWDWFWIDAQHGQFDNRTLIECLRTADGLGVPTLVRVAGHSPEMIGRILDMGATGIMVPMVETSDEAQALVKAMHFAPLGKRSYGGRRVIDLGERKYHLKVKEDLLLVLQIETPIGVNNVDTIAVVEGVDALFYGADDMRMALSLPMDTPLEHPELYAGLKKVAKAAIQHHKIAGAVGFSPVLEMVLAEGYTLIVGCGDAPSIKNISVTRREELYHIIQNKSAKNKEGA